jgi:hypothetical protein
VNNRPGLRRGWAVLAGGCGLVALMFWLRQAAPKASDQAQAPVQALVPAAASAPSIALAAVAPDTTAARAMREPRPRRRDAAPGEFDLCGIGWRPGEPVQQAERPDARPDVADQASPAAAAAPAFRLPAALGDDALALAMPRILQALASSGDVRHQAAALLLGGGVSATARADAQGQADRLRLLAQLALTSANPVVMQWALQACAAAASSAPCNGLSARHWLRIAPDNLAPWLYLLAQEPMALDEALHGMALSRRVDFSVQRLPAVVDQIWPDDLPPYLREVMAERLVGIEVAQPTHWTALLRACDSTLLADANRHQQCTAIAEVMVGPDSDLPALTLGSSLGQRLGWPPDRVAALRAEAVLLAGIRAEQLKQPYSCASLLHGWVHRMVVDDVGELAWLRLRQQAHLDVQADTAAGR